jgi:predicted enzyme related to lactoylglutathione lyase
MAEVKPHFIWYELMTTDQDAAEKFYRAVVGWKTADAGQPDMRYTILSAGDRGMGGVMKIPAAGMPPAWLGYIGVPDTDAAAKQIVEAGGAIHHPPDNIPNVGRFAVVSDPGGAVFQLLTPLPRQDEPPPADLKTLGLVSWHELYSSIGEKAAFDFYAGQFGWETLDLMDMGEMGKYRIFGAGGVPMGGMMDKPKEAPASAWGFYVNVDSIGAAIERIKHNGGQITMGPNEVPGNQWVVQGLDPQGATFALVSDNR